MNDQLTPDDVRAWRKAAGLNQLEFAALLGLSRPTIARIEGGSLRAPKWMALAKIGWERQAVIHDMG